MTPRIPGIAERVELAPGASLAKLRQAVADALRPDPRYSVSQWADAYRIIDGAAGAEAGPYSTDRTPYVREIADAFGVGHPAERIVFRKSAQIGGSEILNNVIGYRIDASPGPILLVESTVETAKKYSTQRIAPMIAASPTLRAKVADPRSKDSTNTIFAKAFPGGTLSIIGSNSSSAMRSMPIGVALLDEVDSYPHDVDQEGDPIKLIEKRTSTFGARRKIGMVSTPLIKKTSRIDKAFQLSDQRFYFVPCPHCDDFQTLQWEFLRWDKTESGESLPKTAHYICQHCGARIEEYQKTAMLAQGQWRATAESVDGITIGFAINALYSPVGWYSWASIVFDWLDAQGDPAKLQVFVNTVLGEAWDPIQGDAVDAHTLEDRAVDYLGDDGARQQLPAGVRVITAGVDVQPTRLEVEIVGWGMRQESWSLAYLVLDGDPTVPDGAEGSVWQALDAALAEPWAHPSGVDLQVAACCVDSGGANTADVYAYCLTRRARRIWAIKGAPGAGRPIWPVRASKAAKSKVELFVLGVDSAKEQFYGRLKIEQPGPGYCHFPTGRPAAYFVGLVSERPIRSYRHGHVKTIWEKISSKIRNEALDCRVYATGALNGWLWRGNRIDTALDNMIRRHDDQSSQRPAPASGGRANWLSKSGGAIAGNRKGWLK